MKAKEEYTTNLQVVIDTIVEETQKYFAFRCETEGLKGAIILMHIRTEEIYQEEE